MVLVMASYMSAMKLMRKDVDANLGGPSFTVAMTPRLTRTP